MEPSHLFQEAQEPPKNQGPVRQHGLNLVKGICTGSQVRSWRFFSGKTHLGASLKGGKPTYANQTSQTVTAFRSWKQKKHEKNTLPQKRRVETSMTGGWCFPLRHVVDVGVFFFLVGRLTWELTQVVHPKKKRTISTTNASGTPQTPPTLTGHISNVKSKM